MALRRHLRIDEDEDFVHVFQFDSQRHYRYSDGAVRKMKGMLETGVDMDAVWREHGSSGRRPRAT